MELGLLLHLLFLFALYSLEMWAIGYLAPKSIIETVYKQSGVSIAWASALFGGICILLGILETADFISPLVESLAPAIGEDKTFSYRIALLIESLCRVEMILFPGLCSIQEHDHSR